MANKKQTYWYVMVMTNDGPVFVTGVSYSDKTAHWDKDKEPLELGRYRAEDLTLGLNLNFHSAFTVCSKWKLDNQPYLYGMGKFTWKCNKPKKDKKVVDKE